MLNTHLHFHCIVIDGVFDAAVAGGVSFHPASGLDAQLIGAVQAAVRRRLLRALARRGLLTPEDAQRMAAWEHGGGFSIDARVRIAAHDRDGLERLLRYCARPAFALERLREIDPEHLVYESIKPGPSGSVSLLLTPLELLDRLAALIPPPRRHRHRYLGVLAPNSPLRAAVTALAQPAGAGTIAAVAVAVAVAVATPPTASALPPAAATAAPLHRQAARYAWALLLARIYGAFPLICPRCGGEMRIIAFITAPSAVRQILAHLGEPTAPPRLAKARGPPLWATQDAALGALDPQAQPAPDYQFDVRHEVACKSCSHYQGRREPPVSPGESRSLNKERL